MPQSNRVPEDYEQRVYAGVLGKIIGVYLGRPIEGWSNERIEQELGEIWYYVHEKLQMSLVVADDDISGTFTFLRAMVDHGISSRLTAEAIGKTWLNYLIEGRTVLWWGGIGLSTEHTAYYRLKSGVPAPLSGSMERNGQVVAEQIGAQIFIDGWGMICPANPELAVELAGKAGSVSHDGEAIFAAQFIAAMIAIAFTESRIGTILRSAQTYIPPGSLIYQIVDDVLEWNNQNNRDWRWCFRNIESKYGYDTYGGNCHVVPNFAVIILALVYSDDDFQKSLMIANTAGWDTDCNAANVGCIMGIKNGLDRINATVDFRTPVADRILLPTADGGRCISDALQEAYRVVNIGRVLAGQRPVVPDAGARFHFNLPGAVQGFTVPNTPECQGVSILSNESVGRFSETGEATSERALALHYKHLGPGRIATILTPTFVQPDQLKSTGYGVECSPTLYPGQMLRARVVAGESSQNLVDISMVMQVYGDKDALETIDIVTQTFAPGEAHHFHVLVPDTGGRPIANVGLTVRGDSAKGTVYLDWLHWEGTPSTTFTKPDGKPGDAWRKAWVNAASEWGQWGTWDGNVFKVIQNSADDGLVLTGTREWSHYTVETTLYAHMADRIGIVICGRGLRRYVALTLSPDGMARLIERYDDQTAIVAEVPLEWCLDLHYRVTVSTKRDGTILATVEPPDPSSDPVPLSARIAPERAVGNIGLLVAAGHAQFGEVTVRSAD